FCGGFTTFSSLADDMYLLLQQKQWLGFGLYVGLSFVLGLLLVWLGRSLVKTI
ncbi:MAG: CrcB family protein, partial [Alistipes sp.]|nr:CrcB family protein [Alistipes sp.]